MELPAQFTVLRQDRAYHALSQTCHKAIQQDMPRALSRIEFTVFAVTCETNKIKVDNSKVFCQRSGTTLKQATWFRTVPNKINEFRNRGTQIVSHKSVAVSERALKHSSLINAFGFDTVANAPPIRPKRFST